MNFTTPGTFDFDPVALNLNPAGDNIFNFTTINIGSGVTLRLRSSKLRGKPVVWLATGNVTITGTIDLNGATAPSLGSAGADWITLRVPTEPGAGGYPGGVGARPGTSAYPGLGPGGAPTQADPNCGVGGNASFATVGGSTTPAAPTYGNIQLVPLIGGSGGSGGCLRAGTPQTDGSGGTGGAGGGAIRIVSTTLISLNGTITAGGGDPGAGRGAGAGGGTPGGSGSGGAINLIAPTVTGTGSVRTGGGGNGSGGSGYNLINAATNTFTPGFTSGVYTTRPLIAPPLPTFTSTPTISIDSINSVNVPQPPKGQFLTPDVTINSPSAVIINISAVGVPLGTVVKLNVQSELGPDQTISCNPLAGTTASSTATCSAAFPTSVSRLLAFASW